jgi:hypothetical protein
MIADFMARMSVLMSVLIRQQMAGLRHRQPDLGIWPHAK